MLITTMVLIIASALSLGISFIPLKSAWHVAIGVSIAVLQAGLLLLFSTQLITGPRLVWVVIVASTVWLTILMTLTLVDYLSRSLLPYAPGH